MVKLDKTGNGVGQDGRKVFVPQHKKPPSRLAGVNKFFSKLNPAAMFARKPLIPTARSVFVNQPLPTGPEWRDKKGRIVKERRYATNQNITSKYTVITFLPRNLFEQFRRIANIFFLAIAILQFFPKFATVSPGLVILPLLAVLAITALKDGYEDFKRHQADRKVNHTVIQVLKGGEGYNDGLLSIDTNSSSVDAKPGYHNYNCMANKSKTFVPAINLPRGRKRKAKRNKSDPATTEALSDGVVEGGDASWQAARPSGNTNSAPLESPFGDNRRELQQSAVVNSPSSDPECFDDLKELGWQQTIWEDVRVGDFIKIYDNEQIPADIVLCSTSEEEDVCFVETKNLDGETNLKSRHGVPELSHLRSAADCGRARFQTDIEPPDVNMYKLNGAVMFNQERDVNGDGHPLVHPIDLQTTILRGCVLRNTSWIIGIVVFTGADTKIIMNSGATPSKRSKVERQMNPQVLLNLALLAVVAVVCAIVDHFNEVRWDKQQAYWELYADSSGDNPQVNALVTFANAFITFQNIVPISLYISIEFVRTAQALFIYWDHAIKYVKDGVTTRTTARSWNLSDDLGQIEYVFSDKTGTLTQNSMVFRQCSIGGKVYTGDGAIPEGTIVDGKHSLEKSDAPSATSSDAPLAKKQEDEDPSKSAKIKTVLPKEVLAPFHDQELLSDLNDTETEQSRLLHGFFAVLGLCHTALAAEIEPGVIEYKAQSPDEAALVQAAADVGFIFRGRDRNIMRLTTPFSDEPDEYELLQVLEFNSSRKRMSVILRKLDEDNRLFLLCKGADNVIFERLAPGNEENKKKTDSDLQYFAGEGLRTLCLAYKVLEESQYEEWAARFHDASVALENREDRIESVSASIENELVLLGATAIEDRLQDGVPEAIADLKQAGIKVWVATGDKLETAVAIGYTTNLLTRDSNMIIVREGKTEIYDQLKNAIEAFFHEDIRQMDRNGELHPVSSGHELRRLDTGVTSLVGRDNGTRPGGFSLVIDGGALRHAFQDAATEELLLHLSTQCNTVICCRVSPLQKAQIVHLIKDNLGVMCLAIGDGANDVSMIQAADIGVGISGEEGLQAVNSSDYAIAQFRYLRRLLFVHGHWSYLRNSNMILNFFYKNVMGVGVLFWFQIYCGWSSTYVFEYTYLLFWNVFWTLLPVIALGLFDRDVDADSLMALPELYRVAKGSNWFGFRRFLTVILQGVYQSAVVFFFINYAYVTTTARSDGYNVGQYEMSTVMAIGAVMVANMFTGLNTECWNVWVWISVLIGPILIWAFTAIYSIIPPSTFATNAYGNDHYLFPSALFWFGWIFVFFVALAPQYLGRFWRHAYRPTDIDIVASLRHDHPEIDVATHPMLGGRRKEERKIAAQASRPSMSAGRSENRPSMTGRRSESGPGTYHFGADQEDRLPEMMGRPSYTGSRRDGLGRMQPASLRGSEVDMSNGLRRQESRGFDFDVEERSIAVRRLNSRLSQFSKPHDMGTFPNATTRDSPAKARLRAGSIGAGFSSLRTRAGSVLRPKKGVAAGTTGSNVIKDEEAL